MRERDRIQSRLWREQLEAEERVEREARERPIREATEQLEKNYLELTQVYKERLVGKVPDQDRFIDPQVGPNVRMSLKDAQSFTAKQWDLFVGQHPEVFVSAELLDLLDSYFAKEQIRIVTADMFAKLIERFADCGLLPERPTPEPEPVPDTPEISDETPPGPTMHEGWDPDTDLPIQLTQRQVNLLTADQFKKIFKLKNMTFPTVGPGPRGLR